MADESQGKGMKKFRVFIVDDNAFIRQGLTYRLDHEPDLTVCGEADGVQSAMEKIPSLRPDIALIDLCLNGKNMDGIDLIRMLKGQDVKLPLLVLSAHEESIFAKDAFAAGAQGYLMKQDSRKNLIKAVRQILNGEKYLSDKERGT